MKIKNLFLAILALGLFSLTVSAEMMPMPMPTMARVKGTLAGYSDSSNFMILSTKHGFLSVSVNPVTVIKRHGSRIAMTELVIGERISVRYNKMNMMVALAKVTQPAIDGYVTYIAPIAGPRMANSKPDYLVVFTPEGGEPKSLKINSATTSILRDGVSVSASQLQVGDKAVAAYQQDNSMASNISATSAAVAPTVESGVISLLNLGDPTTLELTTDIHTVPMTATDASVKVTLDGSPVTLNDLREGFHANISYDPVNLTAFQIDAISN